MIESKEKAAFGRPFLFSASIIWNNGTSTLYSGGINGCGQMLNELSRTSYAVALLTAALLTVSVPAPAQQRPPVVQDQSEIIQLQNRIQRQQFEQQQQLNRQIDRQQVTQPPVQRPQVPTFQQNCQTQVTGSGYVRNCR